MAKSTQEIQGAVDVAALVAENDALKATQVAQQAQNDQVLDALIEMREELAAVKAGQVAPAPVTDPQAVLAAEWAALRDEFKDLPNIEVIEQRIVAGVDAAPALRLKAAPGGIPEPTPSEDPHGERCYWKLRWFNFGIEGRAERFAGEGYLKVDRNELQDPDSIPNLQLTDASVRKGERGQEVLGKIPRKLYAFKKRRDALRTGQLMTSASGLRAHMSNQVASLAGRTGGNADQAGSFVQGKGFDLTIKESPPERFTA